MIDITRDGAVALVLFGNPPVNALGLALRRQIAAALSQLDADPSVAAIVLAGAGRTFSGGADIREFGAPPLAPTLHDLIAQIEATAGPVIAALHGTVMGGGLELALACHFRVAAPDARLGLPEIKLGLLPGAGGTQRLPRAIGAEEALKMVLTGEPLAAADALRLGLVDAIPVGDIAQGGVAFAQRILAEKRPLRLLRDDDGKLAATRADPSGFEALAATFAKRSRGLVAPLECIASVRRALDMPVAEGLEREREIFAHLLAGRQSKAQRHLFFAERAALKVPGMAADAKAREIAGVAVIGAGTMGGGIAMCFASAGLPVTLIDANETALRNGLAVIAANYRATVARGGLDAAEAEARIARIAGSAELEAAASADLAIEAVFEDLDLKQAIFRQLDGIARPGAILATNTSTLDVDAIAAATARPGDVIGMHFFSPANVMRLLEIVRARMTSPGALLTALAAARRIGKVAVVSGVCDGFIGNRMLAQRTQQCEQLLLEGALPAQVDHVLVEFGFPMGPFAMADLAGLDVGWRIRRGRGAVAAIADAIHDAGRLGQKSGGGYFRYAPGSRVPLPDAAVERIVRDASAAAGIVRRAIADDEILERLLYPMINEAARILDEGIAARPGDIDIVWVHGYGWPAGTGGPMFHADGIGLPAICERLAAYARQTGDARLAPAPLLRRLAGAGAGFASLEGGA